ncbi:MAG: DUF2911 domain-containing protein [Chitinophagaceae bacterium]|nr:MAG: DUF2911 domain-containing protein [Chitinophagaceae bacterium]
MSQTATTTARPMGVSISRAVLFLSVLLSAAGCADEKEEKPVRFSDNGVLVYRLGNDTIGYQHFDIMGDTVRLQTIYFPGGYTYSVTDAVLTAGGTIKKSETVFHVKDSSRELRERGPRRVFPSPDAVDRKGKPVKGPEFISGGPFAISDGGPVTDYLFPALPHYITGAEKVNGAQLAFRELRPFSLLRSAPTMVYLSGDFMGHVTLVIDSAGRLESVEATRSPLGVTGKVYRNISFDSLLRVTRTRADLDAVAPLSPVSKTITHFPELDVMLNYSRPSKRGRRVMGKLIPYSETWRMGANRVTEITFSEPVYFNKHPLKPGTYSLFALFGKDAGILTINHESGIWGTDHDVTWDGERVPFRMSRPSTPLEQLDIWVVRVGPGLFTLWVEWDYLQASVDFSMKPILGVEGDE